MPVNIGKSSFPKSTWGKCSNFLQDWRAENCIRTSASRIPSNVVKIVKASRDEPPLIGMKTFSSNPVSTGSPPSISPSKIDRPLVWDNWEEDSSTIWDRRRWRHRNLDKFQRKEVGRSLERHWQSQNSGQSSFKTTSNTWESVDMRCVERCAYIQ